MAAEGSREVEVGFAPEWHSAPAASLYSSFCPSCQKLARLWLRRKGLQVYLRNRVEGEMLKAGMGGRKFGEVVKWETRNDVARTRCGPPK